MRSQHFADDTVIGSRLLLPKLWQRLSPILVKNRSRVGLAVLCLLGAKLALMYIPFLLKALVDGLDTDPNQLAIQAILILVLASQTPLFRSLELLINSLRTNTSVQTNQLTIPFSINALS